jgi:hypothetical protein
MSDEIGLEKFRKLSITALVTGILTYSYLYLIPQLIGFLVLTLRNYIQNEITITCIVGAVVFIIMGLPIAAIVCGSIDLKRIRAGLYSKKGKGFDITGIVLGGVIILFALFFVIGDIIVG